MSRVKREKVISARTSAASGTAKVLHRMTLGGRLLEEFEEIIAYLDVNTALAGTTPTMNIYLQRAVTDTPDEDTDADWEDFYAFPQVTTVLAERTAWLPLMRAGPTDESAGGGNREMASLAVDVLRPGHWGDRIRVVEKMGGTVTTQAVYDLTLTGILRTAE